MPSSHLPITPSPAHSPPAQATMHLLPVRLKSAARADAERYWCPKPMKTPDAAPSPPQAQVQTQTTGEVEETGKEEGETHEVTFRGRRLLGKELCVPEGFTGYVLATTPNPTLHITSYGDDDEAPQDIFTPLAHFNKMVIWGHDEVPAIEGGAGGDVVLRGVQEWLGWAHMIHEISNDDDDEEEEEEKDVAVGA